MRLINCSTLRLETFFGDNIPQYAILSHTWGDEEVTFADLPFDQSTTARPGYQKIVLTCAQAIRDGLDYAWVDTCCIDKSSSSELSEAINSMFAWYTESTLCYAYLSDVQVANMNEDFPRSRWFARGWTLQELLAPKDVIFYDQQWNELGKKSEHVEWISKIAGIDPEALLSTSDPYTYDALSSFCVAKKMSWASHRETTRPEDVAYCLLGIFDVNMPLLYGEGDQAFLRLQEEIIRRTDDDSILAWGLEPEMNHPLGLVSDSVKSEMAGPSTESDMLARSPKDFIHCANLRYTSGSTSPFTLTNVGLQIQLPLVSVYQAHDEITSQSGGGWLGLLSCSSDTSQEFLGIPLVPNMNNDGPISRMSRVGIPLMPLGATSAVTLVVGPRAAVKSVRGEIIISRYPSNSVSDYYWGRKYVIVKESRKLRKTGYRVNKSTRPNNTQHNGDVDDSYSKWNPETLTFTVKYHHRFGSMIEFCFEQSGNEDKSAFTIFMHTASSRVTVRKGNSFPKDYKRRVYKCLVGQSTQDDNDNILIPGGDREMLKVSARINQTEVYRHRLFEVIVQAVQVSTSTLQC